MKLSLLIFLTFKILICQSNEYIVNELHTTYGWNQINDNRKENDLPAIFTKEIFGAEYQALMIKDTISVNSKKIINVISNVENYDTIFVSSKLVSTTVISRKKNMIDAYQHLPVPIPFISDRHYIFRMSGFEDESNEISWILLNKNDKNYIDYVLNRENFLDNVIFLNTGVGIWKINKLDQDVSEVSYRVYMETGGRLPKFLVEWLNKTAANNIFNDVKNASLN